jgi:hypothetical protein
MSIFYKVSRLWVDYVRGVDYTKKVYSGENFDEKIGIKFFKFLLCDVYRFNMPANFRILDENCGKSL